MIKKIGALSAALIAAMSLVSLAGAQTVTPLVCSPATQTVFAGQSATFVATGGNPSLPYTWSATNATLRNPAGSFSSFVVTYPAAGTQTVTVTNGSSVAACTLYVNAVTSNIVPTVPNTGAGGGAAYNFGLLVLVAIGASLAAFGAKRIAREKDE